MKQLKITSDGLFMNTQVTLDGEPLPGVRSLTVSIDPHDGFCVATLVIEHIDFDLKTIVTKEHAMELSTESYADAAS